MIGTSTLFAINSVYKAFLNISESLMFRKALIITLVCIALNGIAQDKILLPSGSSLNVSVKNAEGDSVRFSANGLIQSLAKKDVMFVLHEYGRTEMFNKYTRKLTRSDNTRTPHTIGIGLVYFIPVRSEVYSKQDGFEFKAGFGGLIMYQYNFQKVRQLSLRATLEYQSANGRGDTVGTGVAKMQVIPLTVGLKYYHGK